LEGRTVSVDGYRFGFQNQEKDDEVLGLGNSYSAEYWQYSPRIARRVNIDPKLRIWISSYHSYSNNPICKVDRLGASDDDYRIDREGNLELVRKTKDNYNTITGIGSNNREMTITVSKGIIENAERNIECKLTRSFLNDNNNSVLENCQYCVDLYNGSEDELMPTFIFFANVTDVEWSLYSAGEESIIATSHNSSTEVSWQIIKNDQSFLNSSFNRFDHNHPAGSTSPSGLYSENKRGDMALILSMKKTFINQNIKFNIYTIKEGFTEYDENSKLKAVVTSKKMERPLTEKQDFSLSNNLLFTHD
jgi:hypothetical protein